MPIIDDWSRREAGRQMALWLSRHRVSEDFRMTFNVSAGSLKRYDFDQLVGEEFEATGLPHGSMELEVTENILISNFEASAALLNRIKERGINIAVDDFGTGYSSLAYLKRLPVSTMKIDRIFLMNVPDNEADCRILRAMITMAKTLDFRVIVEGVETKRQMELCRRFGADVLQGYYLSRPIPAAEFEAKFLCPQPVVFMREAEAILPATLAHG